MLPEQFLERMEKMLGREYPAFLDHLKEEPSRALRVNGRKCSPQRLAEGAGFHLDPVQWSENGYYYEEDDRPGRHPFHAAGAYYIQDASAQAAAEYLDPRPGERVLDLCAAPGGKSTQIGAAMGGEGILFCNEIHPARARILSENIERMGIVNAVVTNETPQRLAAAFPEYFHRILVDAPCSGEGMFRKNEDAAGEWSRENVEMCARRQDEILDCAADMLLPGGRLVYATCTFSPQEDEGTAERFLKRHPEFGLAPVKLYPGMEPGRREWRQWDSGKVPLEPANSPEPEGEWEGTVRLWPHRIKGEGHFLAVFIKREGQAVKREPRRQQGLKKKEYQPWLDFGTENLTGEAVKGLADPGEYLLFGQQLYLLPEGCPSLDKLRVLRPGLHLGTLKKNRYEPAHALALALSPKDVRHFVGFPSSSPEIMAYLTGQAIGDVQGLEKGWYLIAADHMSLGWGKFDGRVLKNHYPKGLRW